MTSCSLIGGFAYEFGRCLFWAAALALTAGLVGIGWLAVLCIYVLTSRRYTRL